MVARRIRIVYGRQASRFFKACIAWTIGDDIMSHLVKSMGGLYIKERFKSKEEADAFMEGFKEGALEPFSYDVATENRWDEYR